MKKIYWRTVNGAVHMKNRVGEILKGEEGMGTVEVILIILEIFTQRRRLMRNFFSIGKKVQMYIDYKVRNWKVNRYMKMR